MILRLFGSRASNTYREDSDIDVMADFQGDDESMLQELLNRYSVEGGGPLDLFVLVQADDEHHLVAYLDKSNNPRTVTIGGDYELDEHYDRCRTISFDELAKLCAQVDSAFSRHTLADRNKRKLSSRL